MSKKPDDNNAGTTGGAGTSPGNGGGGSTGPGRPGGGNNGGTTHPPNR